MAITTLDGAIAGMTPPYSVTKAVTPTLVAGRPASLFYLGGAPAAAAAPSPGIGGAALTSYAGQLPFTNPVSGNTYLARFQGQATIAGTLILADRLWHNSGISSTSTAEQTFTSSAIIPARDATGTTDGVGVYAAMEVSGAMGAGTPTITFKYDSVGTANQTATNVDPVVASSAVGAFYRIGLAAGDKGVKKAVSVTFSATMTSGTIHAVLYRPLASLEITNGNVPNAIDALTAGFPRLYDNTVPFLIFIPSTTTASNISGQVIYAQG